jgi:hypothetical protein
MATKNQILLTGLMLICLMSIGTILGYAAAVIQHQINQTTEQQDLSGIMHAQDKLTPGLMSIDGVVGTGIGQHNGAPCIMVLLADDSAELKAKIPSEFEGYPIVVEVTGYSYACTG